MEVWALRAELARSEAAAAVMQKRLRQTELQLLDKMKLQRQELHAFSSLLEHGLLNTVFTFLGPGYWLYVAGVSRGVRGTYLSSVPKRKRGSAGASRKTSFQAALATMATFEVAEQANVCSCKKRKAFSRAAGEHAPVCVLDHLRFARFEFKCQALIISAARCGRLDVLAWQGYHYGLDLWSEPVSTILRDAAARGDTDILGWVWPQLQQPDFGDDAQARHFNNVVLPLWEVAAHHGRLRTLQWLFAACPPVTRPLNPAVPRLLHAAALGGHRDVMHWLEKLLEVRQSWVSASAAARGGHWALAQDIMNAPGSFLVMDDVCQALVEALQFAIAPGCPWRGWSPAVCARLRAAAARGRQARRAAAAAALEWAHAAGALCGCAAAASDAEEDASEDEPEDESDDEFA
ncbi:hypothetical protein JKP88DRAFT_240657 [Tribonema minus]|uniref:Uncharacterized protein n=1 Tax=Tribonema minus TaxID=303371 RepID=A0A835ZQ67_9STRA|nr:hypothetical protein JKP88DRAFT_240657 [Tribonema minus]